MGWMWILWLFGAVVVVGAAWSFLRPRDRGNLRGESPEAILKRRYASGEIDQDEYERALRNLRR